MLDSVAPTSFAARRKYNQYCIYKLDFFFEKRRKTCKYNIDCIFF